jgi:undecaprenyl-phosphate galactose phosphotransferase
MPTAVYRKWVRPKPPNFLSISIRHDPLKRTFDLAFSASVLLLSSPLTLLLALLVRLSSKGPVFYKSVRLGRGGRVIYCYKFRSMYQDAEERLKELLSSDLQKRTEWKKYQKIKNDPRITPIGNFLRKTSLDEWPQFFNVLKGDLSVVGPRPPTLLGSEDSFAKEIRKLYGPSTDTILSIRPGLTGVWQTSGRSKIPFKERVRIEEQYAESRTFLKDLLLIAKTIPVMLFSKGAY